MGLQSNKCTSNKCYCFMTGFHASSNPPIPPRLPPELAEEKLSTSEWKVRQKLKKDAAEAWEKEFDEDYILTNPEDAITAWTLGIVASTLFHAKTQSMGADASHITVKLRKLVELEKEKSYSAGLQKGLTLAAESLPGIQDSGCQGYDDRPHYCSNCCQSGGEIISDYRAEALSRIEEKIKSLEDKG